MAVNSVKAVVNGTTYTLTLNSSTGAYEGTITAPSKSSFKQSGGYYGVTVTAYDDYGNSDFEKGFTYIKIYSKKIEDLNVLKEYANSNNFDLVSLTSSGYSNHLLKNSDYSITLINNNQQTKDLCSKIIPSNNPDRLFKEVEKLYHDKKMKH